MKKAITLLSFLLLLNYSHATIHYVVVGEEILTQRYYDMDNNGDFNFEFTYNGGQHPYTLVPSDTFNFPADDAQNLVKAYSSGASLGTVNWHNQIIGYLTGSDLDYFLQTEKYVMVKFAVGANTYYGWFLLDNTNLNYNMFVVSYAWNDVPNQPISPGELPTSVSEIPVNTFNITQLNGTINILTPGNYNATITNMIGQQVLKQNVTSGQIYAGSLAQGIYILALTDEKGKVMTRKIVL